MQLPTDVKHVDHNEFNLTGEIWLADTVVIVV